MDAYRLNVKLYAAPEVALDLERAIPVFHRYIQDGALDGELLIDVADYKHVPDGSGVMLIAHDANYGLDLSDGRLGLLYARKRPAASPYADRPFADRLRAALRRALAACRLLEQEPSLGGLRFPGDRLAVRINDRLLAPDTPATFAAVEPELRALFGELYAEGYDLRREDDPGACFGVQVRAAVAPGVEALLGRLEAARVAVAT